MGAFDSLSSFAVACIDKGMETDEYKMRRALLDDGEERHRRLMEGRNRLAAQAVPKPTQPPKPVTVGGLKVDTKNMTGKQFLLTAGLMLAVSIGKKYFESK